MLRNTTLGFATNRHNAWQSSSKLSDLIKSLDIFETQTDGSNQLKLRKRAKSSDKAADSAPAAKTSATKAGTTAKPAPRTAAKPTRRPSPLQQTDSRRPKRR